MASKLAPGDSSTEDRGPLTIRTDRHHDGISITVTYGPNYSSVLSRPFGNDRLPAARAWYRDLTAAADQGLPVWRIEAQMAALLEAAEALHFQQNGLCA